MKKNNIIVKVWGGVGNQLFIYAFARILSLVTGNKTVLDIRTGFTNDGYKRTYRLNDFSISLFPAPCFYILSFSARRKMPYLRHLLSPIFDFYEEDEKRPLQSLDSISGICLSKILYLQGYWQYFDFSFYRSLLLKDLKFEVEANESYLYYSKLIESSNAVSIHFRRKQYEPIVSMDYYQKAIKYIYDNIEDPVFFVFSDDINWCRHNLAIEIAHYFVENFDDELYELKLMSKCKHFIIANSTFSWWGAWLSQNDEKIVIMPKGYTDVSMNGTVIHV